VTLAVNGGSVPLKVEQGYVSIKRTWKGGDVIDLHLPMPVRRVKANDLVAADKGRIALQRGPMVYAAEWPDNPGGRVRNLMLPPTAQMETEFRTDMLNGVEIVKSRAVALGYDVHGKVSRADQDFVAIPYYAWANRGRGQMIVWIPENEADAKPAPYPTPASTAKVTSSPGHRGMSLRAIQDGEEPQSSSESGSSFDWWPTKGSTEWVEYAFPKPTSISECDVYWFDDTGRGEVRVPAAWRVLYKDGAEWKPVELFSAFGVAKDQYNKVAFRSVTTTGLRLEISAQPNFSIGIQEWKAR
jgi:hypothetical protein